MAFETSFNEQDGIIILRDTKTGTEAEIFVFGALLNALRVQVAGAYRNLVAGYSSPQDAFANMTGAFRSAKLSPFVCRLFKGNYSFEGTDYHITGHFLNGHAIHGLVFGAAYAVDAHGSDETHAFVRLSHDYRGTDKGYPFPYHITIEWKLRAGNSLGVTTTVSHRNSHAIPYTDGWHPYFTLGTSIDDCMLQFDSTTQLEYNTELLPTGKSFTDTRFRNGIRLKDIELDNSFRLEGNNPRCCLSNAGLSITITPDPSYPILQLYIPPDRQSIAIENLSGPPDNFNNHIDLLLLQPGEVRSFGTAYAVDVL